MLDFFRDYLEKWGLLKKLDDLQVDEDLPNFFQAVKLSQADEIVLE